MIHPIALKHPLNSSRDLEIYLERYRFILALKNEVPQEEFQTLSTTRRNVIQQGCYALDSQTEDSSEHTRLWRFLDGKREPFSFVDDDALPTGTVLWVKSRS